jgi:hypothetical protein
MNTIKTAPGAAARAKFKIQREGPGGRHTNDHKNIEDIAILPTPDEIACSRNEYLPFLDLSENHVQGLDGLLDRSFLSSVKTRSVSFEMLFALLSNVSRGVMLLVKAPSARIFITMLTLNLWVTTSAKVWLSQSPLISL